MSRRLLSLFLPFAFLVAAGGHRAPGESAFKQIDSIVKSLSEISGLSEKHSVPYARMTKHQLRHFLSKRIRHTLKPEEIQADELALKMFGLVPQDFDLKQSTIDLLTEQAAAFYDYDERKLFLLDNSSFSSELTTLAHELSHALADQHFDLRKYMDDSGIDDDENLAHTAVVEGQASWLMIAYDLKEAGQPPVPTEEALKAVLNSSEGSVGDYPVLKSSPLYIQQSLLFPYTEGTVFFDAVYHKQGKAAFSAVFTDAPKDSAQILHPERYFAHTYAEGPELPKLPIEQHAKKVSEGSVGEFDHTILLWQFVGEASAKALAPHLKGGQFRIFSLGDSHPVLLYSSAWDSEEHARDFFADYRQALRHKWKMCDPSVSRGDVFAGDGDNGYFVTAVAGRVVTSVEGLPDLKDLDQVQTLLRNRSLAAHALVSANGSRPVN